MKTVLPYFVIGLLLVVIFRRCGAETVTQVHRIDTLIVRDTVRDLLPVPRTVFVVRTDTVYLATVADTVVQEMAVPIERREYRTDEYYALIEGFRPNLLHMEVYPKTVYITGTTVRNLPVKPRFGVGIQAGYGFAGRRAMPYVGIGLQYNLFTF